MRNDLYILDDLTAAASKLVEENECHERETELALPKDEREKWPLKIGHLC